MPGAEEQRLIQALSGAESGKAFGLSGDWIKVSDVLTTVSTRLRVSEIPIHGGDAGALTKEAMKTAFVKAAEALDKRVEHLGRGQTALLDAGDAIDKARKEYEKLGPEGLEPSYSPHEDPGSEAGIKHRNAFLDELAAFNSQKQHRENVSKAQADHLDQVFTASAEVMQSIHGQKPDIPDPGGPGGGYPPGQPVGGGGGGGVSSGGGGGGGGVITAGVVPDGGGGGGRGDGGPDVVYTPGQGDRPGSLDSPPSAIVPSASGSATGSSGGGLGLGNTAALAAGAAGAGVIGAKLTGALRGALAGGAGGAAGRGTAASAVRGIGSSGRAGGASTLGRGAGAGAGAAGRAGAGSGTAGRSGAGAGRGAGAGAGRGGQGGRAGAGSRAGAGAGGRGGRGGGKDDEQGKAHDEFDVGEDWVGDDDAAPGVIS